MLASPTARPPWTPLLTTWISRASTRNPTAVTWPHGRRLTCSRSSFPSTIAWGPVALPRKPCSNSPPLRSNRHPASHPSSSPKLSTSPGRRVIRGNRQANPRSYFPTQTPRASRTLAIIRATA